MWGCRRGGSFGIILNVKKIPVLEPSSCVNGFTLSTDFSGTPGDVNCLEGWKALSFADFHSNSLVGEKWHVPTPETHQRAAMAK